VAIFQPNSTANKGSCEVQIATQRKVLIRKFYSRKNSGVVPAGVPFLRISRSRKRLIRVRRYSPGRFETRLRLGLICPSTCWNGFRCPAVQLDCFNLRIQRAVVWYGRGFGAGYGPYREPARYVLTKRGDYGPYTAVWAVVPK
jgi:hypothetical protein